MDLSEKIKEAEKHLPNPETYFCDTYYIPIMPEVNPVLSETMRSVPYPEEAPLELMYRIKKGKWVFNSYR